MVEHFEREGGCACSMELSDLLDSDTLECCKHMTDAHTSAGDQSLDELMLAAYDSICEPLAATPADEHGRVATKTVLTHDDHATDSTPFFAARVRKRHSQPATVSMSHKHCVSTYKIITPST